MGMDLSGLQQGGVALILALVAGLLGWRGFNKVGNDNARGNRESRFEENLQKRLDAEVAKNSELREELQKARDGRALLERQLHEAKRRTRNLLDLLDDDKRAVVEKWVQDSAFAPFESGSSRKRS